MIVNRQAKLSSYRFPLVSDVQEVNSFRIRFVVLWVLEEVIAGIEKELIVFVDY